MDGESIRAFARRDWQAVATSKVAYWAEQFAARGGQPAWDAANALLVDVQRAQPGYPTPDQRHDDFAHHVRVCALMALAAHVFTRRPPAR